jgi:hypothetical protein
MCYLSDGLKRVDAALHLLNMPCGHLDNAAYALYMWHVVPFDFIAVTEEFPNNL